MIQNELSKYKLRISLYKSNMLSLVQMYNIALLCMKCYNG